MKEDKTQITKSGNSGLDLKILLKEVIHNLMQDVI